MVTHPSKAELQCYLRDLLPETQSSEIGLHLQTCEECNHLLDELEGGSASVSTEQVSLPPDLAERIQAMAFPRIEGYEIEKEVGRGGMARVVKAIDRNQRTVAIKIPINLHDQELMRLFVKEATTIHHISRSEMADHRRLIEVYDIRLMPVPCIVMAYTPHGTLAEFMQAHGGELVQNPQAIVPLMMQMAEALHTIHHATPQIIHRDVKPANFLLLNSPLNEDGELNVDRIQLALTDLGLAKAANSTTHTRMGDLRGTPQYMAPEVLENPQHATVQSDLYSLGVVFYELLTASRPFPEASPPVMLQRMKNDLPTRPGEIQPMSKIPKNIEAICLKCLEVNPRHRYRTANELIHDLQHWQDGKITARLPGFQRRLWRWGRRNTVAVGTIFSLLILVVIGLVATLYSISQADLRLQERNAADLRAALAINQADLANKEADLVRQELTEQRRLDSQESIAMRAFDEMYAALNQGDFAAAKTSLERVRGALGSDAPPALQAKFSQAEQHFQVAQALDDNRQRRGVLKLDPKLPETSVLLEYEKLFTKLGHFPLNDQSAEQLAASPICMALTNALDDWASACRDTREKQQLYALAKKASPDPQWGDKIRDLASSNDLPALRQLVQSQPLSRLTQPQIAQLASTLPISDPIVGELLKEGITSHPHDFWFNMLAAKRAISMLNGDFGHDRRQQNLAIAHLHTAQAVRPDSLGALFMLAYISSQENYPEQLDLLAKQAGKFDREHWIPHYILTMAAVRRMNLREAMQHIDRAIQLEPNVINLGYAKIQIHYMLGEITEGVSVCQALKKQFSHIPEVNFYLCAGLLYQNKYSETQKLALEYLTLNPNQPEMRLILSVCLLVQGRLIDAKPLIDSITSSDMELAMQLVPVRAMLHYLTGDLDRAQHLLKQSDSLTKDYQTMLMSAFVATSKGNFQEAKEAIIRGRTIVNDNRVNLSQIAGSMIQIQLTAFTNHLKMYQGFSDALGDRLPGVVDSSTATLRNRLEAMNAAEFLYARQFYSTATQFYELAVSTSAGRIGSYVLNVQCGTRVMAARSATLAWSGAGREAFRTKDADRERYLRFAIQCLQDELKEIRQQTKPATGLLDRMNQALSSRGKSDYSTRLGIIRLHRDLEPLRDERYLQQMPAEQADTLRKYWKDVDELYASIHPPLNIPGIKPVWMFE
ncbi:MAG: protein kinase [Zavarzinella sp.]